MNLHHLRGWTKRIGRTGEKAAARYLEAAGYELVCRNCRTERAEIDLIALSGATLVWVEVKTRFRRPRGGRQSDPRENLTEAQKKRLCAGALAYLYHLGDPDVPFRFDLIEVELDRLGARRITHLQQAFSTDLLYRRDRRRAAAGFGGPAATFHPRKSTAL